MTNACRFASMRKAGTFVLAIGMFLSGYLFSRLSCITKPLVSKLSDVPNDWMICPQAMGRLGNRMFEYASTYGIAKDVKRQLVIPADDFLHNSFKLSKTKVLQQTRTSSCRGWNEINAEYVAIYDKNIYKKVLEVQKNVVIRNYVQSWKYFDKYRKEVQEEFTMKDNLTLHAYRILSEAKMKHYPNEEHVTFVGIHIRRGALKMQPSYDIGYLVAPGSYIRDAIKHMEDKYKNPLFVICSVDEGWTMKELKAIKDISKLEYVLTDEPNADFAVLVACNHTIMTVGTFGWWAGYLAGGDVIYYKNPIRDNTELRLQYDKSFSDYFLPNWIGME